MSIFCNETGWVVNGSSVWSKRQGNFMIIKFLQFNKSNKYNFEMNGIDAADQLCIFYRFDVWVWNHKWWWSLFLLILQFTMNNYWI